MYHRVSSSESPLSKQKLVSSSSLGSPVKLRPIATSSSSSPPREILPEEVHRPSRDRRQSIMVSSFRNNVMTMKSYMNSTRLVVLLVLCLQNSMFTTLRRYSQGVLKEAYSKVRLRVQIIIVQYSPCKTRTNDQRLFLSAIALFFSTNSCYWQKSSKSRIRPG